MENSIRLPGTISLKLLLLYGGQELPPPRRGEEEESEGEPVKRIDTKR